jgi:hypothetical protein
MMEKFTLQKPPKPPTTKHYLALFLSIFGLATAFLIYFKYNSINLDLPSLFHKPVTSGLIISPPHLPVASVIDAEAATALTLSLTSNVPGKKFDRFVTIWLENQDFDIAAADR